MFIVSHERVCEKCGKTFQLRQIRPGRGKFCSRECRRTRVEVKCQTCGAGFSTIPSLGGKFCSRKCYEIDETTGTTVVCPVCSISFRTIPSELKRGRKFCSKKCYGEDKHKQPSTKVERNCPICKQPFSVFPSQVSLIKTCGRSKCRRVHRRRLRVMKSCLTCEKTFYVIPSQIAVGGGVYCSLECTRPRVRDTDLELPVFAILDLFGKTYSRNEKIPSERKSGPPFQLDTLIYLKNSTVNLEADGEYWHGSEKQKRSDLRRDKIVEKHGIDVLRLPGKTIKRIAPLADTGAAYCLSELKGMAEGDEAIAQFVRVLEAA